MTLRALTPGAGQVLSNDARAAKRNHPPVEVLEAPGVLKSPVPVEALYNRDVAHEVTLRSLLQRKGYGDLGSVRRGA